MLRRFRRSAEKRGLAGLEPIEAAVVEIGRVLRPGGRLLGAAFVKDTKGLRRRFLLRPHVGDFGRMCTEAELLAWLGEAGLAVTSSSRSGPMMFFEALA